MKASVTSLIFLILMLPSASNGTTKEEFLLVCDIDGTREFFVINEKSLVVKFMTAGDDIVLGKIIIKENRYDLHFPKIKKKRKETLVKINRYSGNLEWEYGKPPFGKYSSKNDHAVGLCSKEKNVRKF